MYRMRIVFSLFLATFWASVLQAQTNGQRIDRTKAEKLYQEAKKDFARFEKKHGAFIQTKNVRMHYLTWGSPTGIPLIWSHGSLTNGYELFDVAESLVKAGYYVIAIDYYSHGQTAVPSHAVSLYHVADDIVVLMDQLKIQKAIIGGWSRGGFISTAFYDAYPERVLGLILEDGGSVNMNTYYHKMEPQKLESTLKKIERDWPADTSYAREFDAYYANYDLSGTGNQFPLLAWITKNAEGRWAVGPGILNLFNMSTAEQWSTNILRPTRAPLFAESMAILEPKIVYRNLRVPLLILDPVSKDDFMPFEEENTALQKQHTAFIIHKIYENTGHNIHYERPKQFVADLAYFLKKIKTHNNIE